MIVVVYYRLVDEFFILHDCGGETDARASRNVGYVGLGRP